MTNPLDAIGSDRFDVSIDRNAEVPIGVQLAWALRTRIQDGRFSSGQRLPGLREVAEATGVNVNTVRAVYQRLDQEGLIDSQQGSGTFVASTAPRPSDVATIAANAARDAHETGVDPREVAAALYVSRESTARPTDQAASRRRVLRTQIATLERAIGEIEAAHPGELPASNATRRGPGPTLLGIEALEQVRTQLLRRLVAVQGAIDTQVGEPVGASEPARKTEPDAAPARERRPAKPKAPQSSKRARRPRGGTRAAPAGT